MIRKTDIVRELVAKKEWQSALKIASRFRILSKQDKTDLIRAHECYSNAPFYEQLGFIPEKLKQKGISVLVRLYS